MGFDSPEVVKVINNLVSVYFAQNKYSEAESILKQALVISEKTFGAGSLKVAGVLENLAKVYKKTGRAGEGKKAEERARQIIKKNK